MPVTGDTPSGSMVCVGRVTDTDDVERSGRRSIPSKVCTVCGRDNCKGAFLLLGPRKCLSNERTLLEIEWVAPGAGGLGAKVNMAFVLHLLG